MNTYYKKELDKIDYKKSVTVKFYGHLVGGYEARELNVNIESIKDIKKFLSKIERELKKELKRG